MLVSIEDMNKEKIKALKNEFGIHFKNSPDELGFLEAFIDDLLQAQREEIIKNQENKILGLEIVIKGQNETIDELLKKI